LRILKYRRQTTEFFFWAEKSSKSTGSSSDLRHSVRIDARRSPATGLSSRTDVHARAQTLLPCEIGIGSWASVFSLRMGPPLRLWVSNWQSHNCEFPIGKVTISVFQIGDYLPRFSQRETEFRFRLRSQSTLYLLRNTRRKSVGPRFPFISVPGR
jgi:hypothetical protein